MVTEVITAKSQPPPFIQRELVEGKERITGRHQYLTCLVPAGSVVTVEVKVDGAVVSALGPWTATAQSGKNANAQVRLVVNDNCGLEAFDG